MAIYPFQPLAVALLRLSATINQTRMFPRPLAAINNAETRDLGLGFVGLRVRTRDLGLKAYGVVGTDA